MATVLVVDDRPINREFLVALLSCVGHQVRQAGDGRAALWEARLERPDLVVSDILMPIMDGVELARRLRADPELHDVPVMFYTATYRLDEARALARSCGVSTVIAKPSEPQALLDAVQNELGLPTGVAAPEDTSTWARMSPLPAMDRLCSRYVDELARLQGGLAQERTGAASEARRMPELSEEVEQCVTRAQALNMRLAALIELSVDLGRRKSTTDLLQMFCHAARDILSCRIVVVCILDEDLDVRDFASWGMPEDVAESVRRALDPRAGLLSGLLGEHDPRRVTGTGAELSLLGLPDTHPGIASFLGVPLAPSNEICGWFYAADKLGGAGFTDEDEQIAATLGAQLAPAYGNLLLYDGIRRHAALLELEIDERRQAIGLLRESELRFRQLAENIREVFFLVDLAADQVLYVSPTYEEVYDRSRESFYTHSGAWLDAVHPEDRGDTVRAIEEAKQAHAGGFRIEHRIVRSDGAVRWIRARGFPIRNDEGRVYRIAGLAEDITEEKTQELSIQRLNRIHAVLSGINSTILRVHERQALLEEACRVAFEHGGFPMVWIAMLDPESSVLRPVAHMGLEEHVIAALEAHLAHPDHERWEPARMARRARHAVAHHDISRAMSEDQGPVMGVALERGYRSMLTLPLLPDGVYAGVMVLYAEEAGFFDAEELSLLEELAGDVSFALQYIDKEERLKHLAYYDSLTGLPNTMLFHERLSQAIRRQGESTAAVILVDLDRFTNLNDSLGRRVGDRLLAKVGERLRSSVPEPSYLARIGSDTFAVAFSPLRSETDAGALLHERVFAPLARPFHVDGHELRISARAGIAVYPADGRRAGDLFKNAEAALKAAKSSKARHMFYSAEINARVAEDLALEQRLLAAVDRQEFVLHYQPKVCVTTGEVVGLEALIRWNTPEGELVPPARFIRALEDTELIIDAGRWVLEQVLADFEHWRRIGLEPPRVAVNVSPVQLRYADFAEMVRSLVAASATGASALELEITESVIMKDLELNKERLEMIRKCGVTISIDDFGTGYSSLRYLAELPVQTLKVDRSFVTNITTDGDARKLVSIIIGLAHSFGLSVVAEGVETQAQADVLASMRCDMFQGYLFGAPTPAGEIERCLKGSG